METQIGYILMDKRYTQVLLTLGVYLSYDSALSAANEYIKDKFIDFL